MLLLVLAYHQKVVAQVYGSNIFEFQYGNLPYEDNRDLTTSYNQLNLFYDSDNLSFFGKVEQFITPFEERNYLDLTQKLVQYQDDNFRIKVGNFYETIGRGLLLRSYDIPGSVYEDPFERTRYAFFRDLEGISVEGFNDWIEVKAIRAKPLFNLNPPNFEPDSARRPDLVEAVQVNVFVNDLVSIGGAYMRHNPSFTNNYQDYGSFIFDVNPISNVQLFGEYAFQSNTTPFGFNDEDAFALYSGLNFYSGSFGASLEYKNYNNFRLGQGFNDPPPLIKEHTYAVLNRSTHVLETSNETGIQAELYYTFDAGHTLVSNFALANNNVFIEQKYREFFIEGYYVVDDYLSFKSFFDYAHDDPKLEEQRVSVGVIADKSFDYEWGFVVDLQFQTLNRDFENSGTENYYGSLTFNYQSDLSAGLIFEATTDPQLTDDPRTFTDLETDTRYWLGGNVSYKFNSSHRLDLFAGKRRGGPACTSGICYEILDFEGVELRFSTRF